MPDIDSRFLVRPLGAVYFGRPQSFFAGEAHRARSLFPPPQSAFQGMVRSQLLRAAGVDFASSSPEQLAGLVGEPDELPAGWQLEGPLPARVTEDGRLEPWWPVPRYLLRTERGLVVGRPLDRVGGLAMRDRLTVARDGAAPVLVGRPDRADVAGPAPGWLAPRLLRALLSGEADEWGPGAVGAHWHEPWPPFVHPEARPGLGLQREGAATGAAGVAAHGMLYFLEQLRVGGGAEWAGFYGALRAPKADPRIPRDALESSLGAAGHKGAPAAFEPAPEPLDDWQALREGKHLPDAVAERQRFWLVTGTPVRPRDPWHPVRDGVLPKGVTLHVEAVLADGPVVLGGLRMADGRARDNRAHLPAGTAWLFHLRGGDDGQRAEALRQLNGAHPLGAPAEAAFGHGFTLVGICKEDAT